MRQPTPIDRRGSSAAMPCWPLAVRAAMVIIGLALLLVDVRDSAFYIAWSLIGLALATELAATLVHVLRRTHRQR